MSELHETMMGRKLIEHTLPDIGDQLKRIADALEKFTAPKNTIEVDIYYYTDEHGKKVYDIESMYEDFEDKIKKFDKP